MAIPELEQLEPSSFERTLPKRRKSLRKRIMKRLKRALSWNKRNKPTGERRPTSSVDQTLDAACLHGEKLQDNDDYYYDNDEESDLEDDREPLTHFEEMCLVLQEKLTRFGYPSQQAAKQANSVISFQIPEGSVRRMAEEFDLKFTQI